MRTMLVLRQLAAVLDRKLIAITRGMNLTPHDVLLLGWMEQRPGISGSQLAHRVGRTRQNVQYSLERLSGRGFAEKYSGSYRGRSVGWGLTKRGSALWVRLLRDFQAQEAVLECCGVTTQLIKALDELITHMVRPAESTWGSGLIDVAKEPELPDWDVSGEVQLPSDAAELSSGDEPPAGDPFQGTY